MGSPPRTRTASRTIQGPGSYVWLVAWDEWAQPYWGDLRSNSAAISPDYHILAFRVGIVFVAFIWPFVEVFWEAANCHGLSNRNVCISMFQVPGFGS